LPQQDSLYETWQWLSKLNTPYKLSIFSWISGLCFGIFLISGTDVFPDDLLWNIAQDVLNAFNYPALTYGFEAVSIVVTIVGLLYVAEKIWEYGITGVIVAATGFFSGLALMYTTSLGVSLWLLLGFISLVAAFIAEK
jgi:hypothetical protein